jgi:predicted phosphoribosyltransferase
MLTAVKATVKLGAERIEIAVPTGHSASLAEMGKIATTIYCANVRSGYSFAVADAYKKWSDVSEDEAAQILRRFNRV